MLTERKHSEQLVFPSSLSYREWIGGTL